MDTNAVHKIAELAVQAAGFHSPATDAPILIRHEDGRVINLEPHMAIRSRFRGCFNTPFVTAFADYVKRHANDESAGFIHSTPDADLFAEVFFNLGCQVTPGHADWRAVLVPNATASWKAAREANGQAMDQRTLAEWIEDWSYCIDLVSSSGEDIALGAGTAAIRNINITARSESGHVEADFSGKRTAMEEIEAKASTGTLPARIRMRIVPFAGFQARYIYLRLAIITGEKPRLSLRIIGLEAITEEIATEFREILLREIGDACPMTVGTFEP